MTTNLSTLAWSTPKQINARALFVDGTCYLLDAETQRPLDSMQLALVDAESALTDIAEDEDGDGETSADAAERMRQKAARALARIRAILTKPTTADIP